jgi:Tfp pilus assembly protein PilF
MDSGNGPAARIAFQKELEQNPNDFESNLNLAVLMKQEQDYDGARKLLARALLVRPGDLAARFQVAAVDLLTGNMDAARVNLEGIVKEAPQFVEAHVSLAGVYYRLKRKADGDRERAIVQKLNAERDAQQARGKAQ